MPHRLTDGSWHGPPIAVVTITTHGPYVRFSAIACYAFNKLNEPIVATSTSYPYFAVKTVHSQFELPKRASLIHTHPPTPLRHFASRLFSLSDRPKSSPTYRLGTLFATHLARCKHCDYSLHV
eukprot:6195925-Pleurochrysis_carterae.AAC.1